MEGIVHLQGLKEDEMSMTVIQLVNGLEDGDLPSPWKFRDSYSEYQATSIGSKIIVQELNPANPDSPWTRVIDAPRKPTVSFQVRIPPYDAKETDSLTDGSGY